MTPYLEIGGDYREAAPGIQLVELPLPFSLGLVNIYVVRLSDGWLLVDCGMDTAPCWEALARALEGLGIAWTDIRHLLLTHIHPDHMGLAPRVLQASGATLHLHAADEQLLRRLSDHGAFEEWQREVMLTTAGAPLELVDTVMVSMSLVQRCFHALTPDVRLTGGETFRGLHGLFEVVWTPGHSPGHVCLYSAAQQVLLTGDHILEHISPNIGWDRERDSLGEYLASLDGIAGLDAGLLLPSHGAPFRGHREWIARTRRHHEERCAQILAALDAGSRTAHDVVGKLWTRELSPFHYRFGVFEVLAHLEHLKRHGAVRTASLDGVLCWLR